MGPAAAFAACEGQEVFPNPFRVGRCDGGEGVGFSFPQFLLKPLQSPPAPPAQLCAGEPRLGES